MTVTATLHRKTIAGQADVRIDETDTGTYVVTIAYASTGAVVHTWSTDDLEAALDGYTSRVRAFDAGLTVQAALDAMEAPAPLRLEPAAKGTATVMTPPEVEAIRHAVANTDGMIHRGRGYGAVSISTLHAMARRGFVQLTGPRYRPTGAVVTPLGARTADTNQNLPAALAA